MCDLLDNSIALAYAIGAYSTENHQDTHGHIKHGISATNILKSAKGLFDASAEPISERQKRFISPQLHYAEPITISRSKNSVGNNIALPLTVTTSEVHSWTYDVTDDFIKKMQHYDIKLLTGKTGYTKAVAMAMGYIALPNTAKNAAPDDPIIIGFKGTQGGLIASPIMGVLGYSTPEWETNMNGFSTVTIEKYGISGAIHRGFFETYKSMHQEITDILLEHPHLKERKIYIVGHSLGAALASICAMILKTNINFIARYGCPNIFLYALACPAIGDSNLMKIFNTVVPQTTREAYYINGDPVRKTVFKYTHYEAIDLQKTLLKHRIQVFSNKDYHFFETIRYLKALGNLEHKNYRPLITCKADAADFCNGSKSRTGTYTFSGNPYYTDGPVAITGHRYFSAKELTSGGK